MSATETIQLDPHRVRAARLRLYMTREGLSRRAKCSMQTVWRLHHARAVSLVIAERVAGALGIGVADLVAPGEPGRREAGQLSQAESTSADVKQAS